MADSAHAAAPLPSRRRIGLALAGGGPLGMIYEIGTLRALGDALEGLDFNELTVYVGVSAGAVIAAALANRVSVAQMERILVYNDSAEHPLNPEIFMIPAFAEYWRRARRLPLLLGQALGRYLADPFGQGALEALTHLGQALPTGLFNNEAIHQFLAEVFARDGRSNDFRALRQRLYVVAVELDSGRSVKFGAPGYDHVPISKAVQASTALPGLYPPVEIDGRHYVDGALQRTLHASVALDRGVDLMLCLNPIVPYDASLDAARGHVRRRLVEGGLPLVLSQTLRAMIHSRMRVGMAKYAREYAGTDIVLFEPDPADSTLFFANVFSFANRRRVFEHAYYATLNDLAARRAELESQFARHGIG
ncbi:MAG TPA: patatin-like phospholipase family protein, partial [Candidatus Competibacteraceae bacterium]|nr:patatin-like phospholipase family protein [Candidatus Competibacteraceae bacterium]